MFSVAIKTGVALLGVALCSACSAPPTVASKNAPPASASVSQGDLRLNVPDGWVSERPSSGMRVSQYQLPAAEGDPEAASLVVYYFGPGQGGSVDANLERWIGQIQTPKDKAKTETTSVNGMKVTLLDVTGTYAAGDMGGGGGPAKPNFRMRAGVIETPKGAYFIKLVGPEKTVAKWDQAFQEFVKSAEFKG
jgi:hypothetical protein